MAERVRNIAPFIDDEFVVTSKWWNERINPITGQIEIHRGLDISTFGISKPVYSMLSGIVHSLGFDSSMGNWIIIKDNHEDSPTYGYATLYMHLLQQPLLVRNQPVDAGQKIGDEGTTGTSTGIHLHVEMQDLNRWNNVWHWSYNKDDYLDPTEFMGIDNIQGTRWIYDGTPVPPPEEKKKKKFPWFIYYKRNMNRKSLI